MVFNSTVTKNAGNDLPSGEALLLFMALSDCTGPNDSLIDLDGTTCCNSSHAGG